MQGGLKMDVLGRITNLTIQRKVLEKNLKRAMDEKDPRAVKKANFDLRQTEVGIDRVLSVYA